MFFKRFKQSVAYAGGCSCSLQDQLQKKNVGQGTVGVMSLADPVLALRIALLR